MKYSKDKIEKVLHHDCFQKVGYYNGTLKEFMGECLKELWASGEGFSGKRPICDSGWEEIAGEALVILEPKIGGFSKLKGEENCFEVDDSILYLKTFDWLIDYIFQNNL